MQGSDLQKLNGLIAKLTQAASKGIKVNRNLKEQSQKKYSEGVMMPRMMNKNLSNLQMAGKQD